MAKIPLSITILSLLGIFSGVYNIIIGKNSSTLIFLLLGIIIIFLSIGLFKLLNIVRVATILFSILFILFYFFLIFVYIESGIHYGWGIGLIFYFPLFLWSLFCIIVCSLPHVKNKFHWGWRERSTSLFFQPRYL